MDQTELYKNMIIEHNRSPQNFRVLTEATHSAEGFNPLCGDHLWVYLKVENGVVVDLSFQGAGCAISKASASIMTTVLKGRSVAEAEAVFQDFHTLMTKGTEPSADPRNAKLKVFSNIWQYPSRIKCAGLAWHTLKGALQEEQTPISTE